MGSFEIVLFKTGSMNETVSGATARNLYLLCKGFEALSKTVQTCGVGNLFSNGYRGPLLCSSTNQGYCKYTYC